jgi:hypothetical protein
MVILAKTKVFKLVACPIKPLAVSQSIDKDSTFQLAVK